MSSKKHPDKERDDSAAEKKYSKKAEYNKKNYYSSPVLSSTNTKNSIIYSYTHNGKRNNVVKELAKDKYHAGKDYAYNDSDSKKLQSSVSNIVYPHTSVYKNYEVENQPAFKQEHQSQISHHRNCKYNFNECGAKPKIYNFSNPHNLFIPANTNSTHVQNRFPRYQENVRFQKPTRGNYSKQGNVTKGYSNTGDESKRKSKDTWRKNKEFDNINVTPLLSFHSSKLSHEKDFDLMQFSDDVKLETDSSHFTKTTKLIDFSDDDCNSHSAEESEESQFSVDSSIFNNEIRLDNLKPYLTVKEAFVLVFWDLDNCALPPDKSPVDFVSFIRDTFYEGRTEATFTAACHISKLNTSLIKDLHEADIALIHRNTLNTTAADMSLLQRFQNQYKDSNSAIVFISSDSDFSQILRTMRYQYHIYVTVICKSNPLDSLITAANKYVTFGDILKHLPDQDINKNKQHVVTVTNLPQMEAKIIKNILCEKLKKLSFKISFINASTAKMFFKDYNVSQEALVSLKGFYLGGNAINVTYGTEKKENKKVISKIEKIKNVPSDASECKIVSKNNTPIFQVNEESSSTKGATLCVVLNMRSSDTEYWRLIFEDIWNMNDFSICWDDSTLDGCFLIHFKSLRKAQKAKNILQKDQMNVMGCLKFMILLKHGEDFDVLKASSVSDIENVNKRKVDEHLQIIEMKKSKILRKHENIMNGIKNQAKSEISGATEASNDKLKECKEQIETFNNFSIRAVNAIKSLDYNSNDLDQKLNAILCDFLRECNCITSALPIYAKKEDILKQIRENQVIVIRAETGSGKSTQLTQYIWREMNSYQEGKIICTQPRKIAAISLAKHVSSQIGCSLGDIVGYQVGMSNKMSENTKILYVTDFTMLKLLVSEDLENVSCIIIDEAHERTIYTDILLGMIKQYLPLLPQLRVVITSATIDTSLFRDFFALTDSAVLHISGRTFPVQDEWLTSDVTPGSDYFNKTIDKAFEILSEEPGDVLSFLTTPLETEKASEAFSEKLKRNKAEKNVKVFCLHGKMNSEEQQKIFQNTPQGMRKVVFATNCAETSITIPGIRYVIDCGLVKESKYDAVRNMSILSVGFVSKSSAEQRRGRAGRTQVGKCYRLYSKRNYSSMESNTIPEILRINLGQALLKLLKIGVNNPLQFDFIQSPPKELLMSAMNQLQLLNAVDEDFALTDLGKNMAALPLEPRLCHLIFQGFDNNIGYDTLVTAALVTMSQTIFFRNSDNKDEADKKKKRFCGSENDFITNLEVYKEWVDVPKPLKSQWCVINCINARSMCTVHELVKEIILILQKELNFEVKSKFSKEETTYDTLTKIIFYSYSQNLSVFSGHPKFGYRNLNVSDQLFVHPSSSLVAFEESLKEFVIYDTILKTSRTFIVNVCPIAREIILEASESYCLKTDLKSLDSLTVSKVCVYPLGNKIIINHFIGKKGIKRKEILGKLKEMTNSELVEIDVDVSKGCAQFFSFVRHFDIIKSFVFPIINEAKKSLLNEERDVHLCEDTNFIAVLAAGGRITDVVLPGEFRDIKVILNGTEGIDSVCDKLRSCGAITDIRDWKRYFKVTFDTYASARKALDTYNNETEFLVRSITKNCFVNERDYLYKVFMSFNRRPCTGIAFVSVEPNASSLSLPSFITYKEQLLRLTISKKSQDICVTNLPENTENRELQSSVLAVLPSFTTVTKFVVVRKKSYESTKEETDLIKNNILELFSPYMIKEDITIYLKKPNANDFYWNATLYFKNTVAGETAVSALRNRKCVSNFVSGFILKPHLQTFLCCRSHIFSVLKEEIEKALEFFKENQSDDSSLTINAIPKGNDTVEIKILSNNIRDITDARRSISTILNGDQLNFSNNSHKMQLFSNSGKKLIRKLSEDFQDCYIFQNEFNKIITIYGNETTCNIVKRHINEFLDDIKHDELKEFSLKTNSGKTGVLKQLLKIYGYDMQKLKEDCDISDIEVNKYKQLIKIQGSLLSIAKCEAIIQDIKEKLDANSAEVKGEICPVCYDEVSEDKHRLEYCGHVYCMECLLHLFQSSEKIPLKCESCQDPIVVADIFWAINVKKPLQKVLYRKFLHSFVDSRNDISYCPSPDCSMIFRVTKDEINVFKCPTCGNCICTRCKEFYHSGLPCSLQKTLKSNMDKSLQIWMKKAPALHKACPSCFSPIEKNGGCNYMMCLKCKCHMCWLCLQVFPSEKHVYFHQAHCPTIRHPLM